MDVATDSGPSDRTRLATFPLLDHPARIRLSSNDADHTGDVMIEFGTECRLRRLDVYPSHGNDVSHFSETYDELRGGGRPATPKRG